MADSKNNNFAQSLAEFQGEFIKPKNWWDSGHATQAAVAPWAYSGIDYLKKQAGDPLQALAEKLGQGKRTAQLDWNPDAGMQDYLGAASPKGGEFNTWAQTQNRGDNSMAAYQAWQKSKADAAAKATQDAFDMQTEAGAKRLSPGSFAPIQPMGAAKYGAPQSFLAALKG